MRCIAWLKKGASFCASHDPAREAERRANGAIRRAPGDLGAELGTHGSIARHAARIYQELRNGVLLEELVPRELDARTQKKLGEALGAGELVTLDPKRALAMLATLRFLSALIAVRKAEIRRPGPTSVPGATPAPALSLEEELG